MKTWILLLLMLTAINISGQGQNTRYYRMEKPLHIMEVVVSEERFDLSGICLKGDNWWVVADKPWNHFLYRVDTLNNQVVLETKTDVSVSGRMDLEGIDYAENGFFFCNERSSAVFKYHRGEVTRLALEWDSIEFESWGNTGLEGIAFDSENQTIYLGKERQPQKIFKTKADGGKVREVLKKLTSEHDFQISDLKYDSSYLYVLDRKNYRVLKIDVSEQLLKAVLNYGNVMNHNGEKFYENTRYPMAEALMFDQNRLIIGLDNNSNNFNEKNKWVKQANLEGNNPVIIIFERPQHF
ncbi:MAG: SdiA-regulated domain-containing protein [Bacteroidales bacterium]|nr:SdiA-regulated domain-containing protein [Bacteroidales bacterium]MCF8334199.1 SdiA-regulated domain-containing protein [Bacteroidales bacterium]